MKKWINDHRKFVTIITSIFILCSVLMYMAISKNMSRIQSEKISFATLSKMKRSDIQLFGDKNQYVLAPDNPHLEIGKNYAVTNERQLANITKRDKTNFRIKGEYWNLILYNLEKNGLPERKLDLFQIVRKFDKDSIPINLIGLYYHNGVSYYGVRIEDFSKEEPDFKNVYLNLETEKIEKLSENTNLSQDSDIYRITFATNLSEVIRSMGYNLPLNEITQSSTSDKNLNTNINLYILYPDIEAKMVKEDWTLYIRSDKVTSEEAFETLLHWFAPKGQDILPVYGFNDDLSVSDTQIHNSQEAKVWLQQHPKLREEMMGEGTTDKSEDK